MPNLDTHAGLALSHYPEGGIEFAAGEVFDDMVRMAGGVPNRSGGDSLFGQGIHSNNSVTDPAFDSQPALLSTLDLMNSDMEEAGIARSLRRTCVNIGSDILFSAVSLQRPEACVAYLDVCDFLRTPQGSDLIERYMLPSRRTELTIDKIRQNVQAVIAAGLRTEYTDASFVVDRLRRRVAERPALAFPDNFDQAVLEDIFAVQHNRLVGAANEIYSGTVADIRQDTLDDVKRRLNLPNLPIVPNVLSVVERIRKPITTNRINDWDNIIDRELRFCHVTSDDVRLRFIASRAASHFLLQQSLDIDTELTLSSEDQPAPNFPDGWVGSITHSGEYAAAVVAREQLYRGIGVDLEAKSRRLKREKMLTPYEQQLPELSDVGTLTVVSMKEAIFKAIHPLVARNHPRAFWFQDVEVVDVDVPRSRAEVRMTDTERGKNIATLLGDVSISCYFLENDSFVSALCTVN